MESQSMRRRQTVLGEQLQPSMRTTPQSSTSNLLTVPGQDPLPDPRGDARTHHMRNFSRLSVRYANTSTDDIVGDGASAITVATTDTLDDIDSTLLSPNLDPQTYLVRALAGTTPEELLNFGDRLRAQSQRVTEAEERNLHSSQKAMRTVATSIAQLGPAVAELHKQIADLSLVSEAMQQDANAAKSGLRANQRRLSATSDVDDGGLDEELSTLPVDRRQSMLILNTAWAQNLQSLYRRIEGVQRLLPPAPGRHVVLEEQGFQELNLVTQQAVKPVLLALLNDHLLVASSRNGRYTLDHYWALDGDLQVDVLEDPNVLRVGAPPKSHGYVAPTRARLRAVYSELCKLLELSTSVRKRRSKVASIAGSGRTSSRRTSRQRHARQTSSSSHASIPDLSLEERREAAHIVADVDREMAHRHWSKTVGLLHKYEDTNIVAEQLTERQHKLGELLLTELKTPRSRTMEESVELMSLLISLGRATEARHALLDSATKEIEAQTRYVHFMGDVVNYISQMAVIYFQTIIATVEIYRTAFPSREDSSFVVAWAKSQVDLYASIFNRQLFRISPEAKSYQKCREVSKRESSQLKTLKMDMDFMLRYVWEN